MRDLFRAEPTGKRRKSTADRATACVHARSAAGAFQETKESEGGTVGETAAFVSRLEERAKGSGVAKRGKRGILGAFFGD